MLVYAEANIYLHKAYHQAMEEYLDMKIHSLELAVAHHNENHRLSWLMKSVGETVHTGKRSLVTPVRREIH